MLLFYIPEKNCKNVKNEKLIWGNSSETFYNSVSFQNKGECEPMKTLSFSDAIFNNQSSFATSLIRICYFRFRVDRVILLQQLFVALLTVLGWEKGSFP